MKETKSSGEAEGGGRYLSRLRVSARFPRGSCLPAWVGRIWGRQQVEPPGGSHRREGWGSWVSAGGRDGEMKGRL